jgi:hypothetical protein
MEYELFYGASNVPDTGCFLGNGKIGIFTSISDSVITVDRAVISKSLEYKNGQYAANIIDTFCPFNIEIFSLDDMCPTTVNLVSQELNMITGTHATNYALTRSSNMSSEQTLVFTSQGSYAVGATTNPLSNTDPITMDINNSLYCIRHLPYSSMQVVECINVNKPGVRFLHECWTPSTITDVVYENSVQYVGANFPLYSFTGHGRTSDNKRISFTSCYLFDSSITVRPMGMGTNIASPKSNFHFNCFDLEGISGTFKVYIVTTFTTEYDFDDPRAEGIKISTFICSPNPMAYNSQAVATFIRSRHVDAWQKLWATKITISGKSDASQEQLNEIFNINQCLYSSLYHIYSCIRENFVNDSNINNIPLIDFDGTLIYEADLWLIPLLIILKPDIAKCMIEFRYGSLQLCKQLSASYGYSGAKIPYIDDIVGNRNNLYFNSSAYIHIFNSCMVCINAWNYYRATRDKKWLMDKGYVIIKAIADFLIDTVDIDTNTDEVSLVGVIGLNTRISGSNNTFTNNLVKLSIKYAIEASWELNFEVPETWQTIFSNLPLPKFSNSKVFKVDDSSDDQDLNTVLEVLHIFTPGYWENQNRSNVMSFLDNVKSNLEYYSNNKLVAGEENRAINQSLLGINTGIIASNDPSFLTGFMNIIGTFMTTNISGNWKQMKKDLKILNKRVDPLLTSNLNSITTNVMFINLILQGLLQMRVVGGVSNTRFYYEEMKVMAANYTTMPYYWNTISVVGFGPASNPNTIDVRQNAYDMQYNPPNIGGAYILNGDFSIFTP